MTEDSVVLRADTLSYSAGTGFKFYTMLLSDTVTLQAYTTYYAGIAGPSDCYFIGNEYNATVSSPVPETVNQWIEGTFSLTPPFPAVGDTLSALEGNCNFTYNIRYYLTN